MSEVAGYEELSEVERKARLVSAILWELMPQSQTLSREQNDTRDRARMDVILNSSLFQMSVQRLEHDCLAICGFLPY